jgi:hypothetical protein
MHRNVITWKYCTRALQSCLRHFPLRTTAIALVCGCWGVPQRERGKLIRYDTAWQHERRSLTFGRRGCCGFLGTTRQKSHGISATSHCLIESGKAECRSEGWNRDRTQLHLAPMYNVVFYHNGAWKRALVWSTVRENSASLTIYLRHLECQCNEAGRSSNGSMLSCGYCQ